MIRLPTFIREHSDAVLLEWDTFARTLETERPMDLAALRDHAREMLHAVADDLDAPQTQRERSDKAQGKLDAHVDGQQTAAQQHGAGRALSGFTVEQMVSEFRALRASVLHLWMRQQGQANAEDLQDLTRFNESIDQAIAESITTYARGVRQSRDRFLAVLGHDLRTPIGAIMTSTQFILELGGLGDPQLGLLTQMRGSARRMNRLVGDLLELARTRMGDSIPIVRADTDVGALVQEVLNEVSASHPSHHFQMTKSGDLHGAWDAERLVQAMVNLVSNAVHHGESRRPIMISAQGMPDEVLISVHNEGPPIEPDRMDQLFDVMKEIRPDGTREHRHLGLGLYIVDKIVAAHGGRIDVVSSLEQGTTFTVHLPRASRAAG